MLPRFFRVVLILVATIFNIKAQNQTKERCGIQTPKNLYPWLVAIEYEFSDRSIEIGCTGALISVQHVISKAECIYSNNKEPKSVVLGLFNNAGNCTDKSNGGNCPGETIRVPIRMFIPHPKYSKLRGKSFQTGSYDIALVRLSDTVQYTEYIRPICLTSIDITRLAKTEHELYVTGLDENDINNILHIATSYLDTDECIALSFVRVVPNDLICAKYVEATSSCLTTGGLLVNKREESYELAGLLDIGSSCGLVKRFSHVFLYLDWIRSEIPEWTPCGRRKVKHVELILNAQDTKAGDWPWHVAIYRFEKFNLKYICGGTLVSKTMVLTAAHCATISGVPVSPEILSVTLGKYYLIGVNLESQEREVQSVIVHEDFAPKNHLDNDIALLKLKTEAVYNDYVQPACIWSNDANHRMPINRYIGSVVGWGFDEAEALSSQLKQAFIPKVSDEICIKKNPVFYTNVLNNNKKFCAGWANGTSTCNGDSGGAFLMFVPITPKADSLDAAGSWHVRGIVSLSVALRNHARCDPYQYVVFTDVDKYTDWIQRHLDN